MPILESDLGVGELGEDVLECWYEDVLGPGVPAAVGEKTACSV